MKQDRLAVFLNRWGWLIALVFPVIITFGMYWDATVFSTHYDDSYITYRYALNWADGKGLVFNVGEYTDAASSFFYTGVLALLAKLGLRNLEFWGPFINLIAFCILSWRFYVAGTKSLQINPKLMLTLVLSLGLHEFITSWVANGMETPLFALFTLLFVERYFFNRKHDQWSWLFVLLACFTRPEGLILACAYLGHLGWPHLWNAWRQKSLALRQIRAGLSATMPALGLLGLMVIFYVLKHDYYNVWFSHAALFKTIGEYYQPRPLPLIKFWVMRAFIPALAAVILLVMAFKSRRWRQFDAWLWIYLGVSGLAVLTGPYSDFARYSAHLFPILLLMTGWGLHHCLKQNKRLIHIGATGALIVLVAQSAYAGITRVSFYLSHHNQMVCRLDLGAYIKNNTPANAYIISSDIGAISYQAIDHKFIDMVSLTNRDVLYEYLQRKPADKILLEREGPKFIADSMHRDPKTGKIRIYDFYRQPSLAHINQPADSALIWHIGKPQFTCRAPGVKKWVWQLRPVAFEKKPSLYN